MNARRGFTLIELLVVVSIISILLMMLLPTMGRAREMTRKAVCSAQMHNHGVGVASYIAGYQSYPHFAPWPWMTNKQGTMMRYEDGGFDDGLNGWPKFYGVLEANGIAGSKKTTWGNWYYDGPIDTIWPPGLCPNMDAVKILEHANHAGNFDYDGNWLYWVWFHKWAVGYQWSPFLRATTPNGRDPAVLKREDEDDTWLYQWVMPYVKLNDVWYCTQATNPDQVENTANTAEAWDSWDIESTPSINWWSQKTSYGAITPGWHGGVAMSNRRAMFNSWRHKGSPNILYADGTVKADATYRVDPVAQGLPAEYSGIWANSWQDFDPVWGNYNHLLPRLAYEEGKEPVPGGAP